MIIEIDRSIDTLASSEKPFLDWVKDQYGEGFCESIESEMKKQGENKMSNHGEFYDKNGNLIHVDSSFSLKENNIAEYTKDADLSPPMRHGGLEYKDLTKYIKYIKTLQKIINQAEEDNFSLEELLDGVKELEK